MHAVPDLIESTYNRNEVASQICQKLRKGDIRIGLGLVDRYNSRIVEAIDAYGETDPHYLAQVVVDDFRYDAKLLYADELRPIALEPVVEVIPMAPARLNQLIEDSQRGWPQDELLDAA